MKAEETMGATGLVVAGLLGVHKNTVGRQYRRKGGDRLLRLACLTL